MSPKNQGLKKRKYITLYIKENKIKINMNPSDLISSITTCLSSFLGTAVFWVMFCPNRRCCRLNEIRDIIEKKNGGKKNE